MVIKICFLTINLEVIIKTLGKLVSKDYGFECSYETEDNIT